jgi:hypothetical protein
MGKTKGGLNPKIAAMADALGRVVGLELAAGNTHDARACEWFFDEVRGPVGARRTRPSTPTGCAANSQARGAWLAARQRQTAKYNIIITRNCISIVMSWETSLAASKFTAGSPPVMKNSRKHIWDL